MEKRRFGAGGEERTILDEVFYTWLDINRFDNIMMVSALKSSLRTIRTVIRVCIIPLPILAMLVIVLRDNREAVTDILYRFTIIVFIIWIILFIGEMKRIRREIKEWMSAPHLLQDYHILYPNLYCERIKYKIIIDIINWRKPSIIQDRVFLRQQMEMISESFIRYVNNKVDYNDDFFSAYGNLITTVAVSVAIVLLTTVGLGILSIEMIVFYVCLLATYISIEYFDYYVNNQIDHVSSILANRCANDLRMTYEYVIDQCEQ